MANRIQELIVLLEDEIEQSPRQRLSAGNKRTVDCDRMLDLLGDLKVVVPEEVRQAQTLLLEKDAILREAQSDAMQTLANARIESERMIAQDKIVSEAEQRAEKVLLDAEQKADKLMQEARDYSQTVMEEVQRYLQRYIDLIDETRDDIRRNYRGAPQRFYRSAANTANAEDERREQPLDERESKSSIYAEQEEDETLPDSENIIRALEDR